MQMGDCLFLLPICDGTSKFSVNSIAFTFAPTGPWIDPLFAFEFGPMEAPECAYLLFLFICIAFAYHILHEWNLSLRQKLKKLSDSTALVIMYWWQVTGTCRL